MPTIPISDVDVCNQALGHLGLGPIESLTTPNNSSAKALNRIYVPTKNTVLRAKDWKFAKVKSALSTIADQDIPGWLYVYGYPPNCACVRRVFIDIDSLDPAKIEYEKLFVPLLSRIVIATNYPECYVAYTYKVDNIALFDDACINAISFSLAAQVCKPLTGDSDMAKLMLQIYGSMVSDAARINDGEGFIKPVESSDILDSRG